MKKIGLLLGAALFILAGCFSTGGNTEEKNSTQQEISVSLSGELTTLDSAQYTDVNSSDMIGQLTEGLYRYDEEGEPELALASKEPEVSEDGLTYTFQLKDTNYSDGTPVKAEDFVYAFQTVVDPKTASSSSNRMDIFQNGREIREGDKEVDELGAQAIDDSTLKLQLEDPLPFLPEILTGTPFMPKSKEFAEGEGKQYGTNTEKFLGNGPFVINDWDGNNESWTLEKNPEYWDQDNVQMETINVQVVKEVATGTNLFTDGQLDYTLLADTQAQQYQNDEQAYFEPKAMVGYISPNQKREVTSNVNVRKAILQAIDKDNFAQNILSDGSTPLNGFVASDFAKNPSTDEDFREENGDLLPYDKKAAQQSWEKAKEELGQDEITLELLSADAAMSKKTIEYIQGQLEETLSGLEITIKSVPLQNRLDLQTEGDFDLVFGTWTPDYADPIDFLNFYDSQSGLNTSGYDNPDYDKGLEEARTTLANDPDARWDKLLEMERLLVEEDAAVLPFYQGANAYLKTDRLGGIQVFPFGRTVSYRTTFITE
ncbi:oligopeptide ABC transporter peptide-binding protein [Tetragenococcus halophilus subsp. halophilus]|uniref:Oligopeptide ABC transporter peptide-binding protein n=1 Tax=Tetragenococcus halophilus (strain DSM 20338 / JCM 20259 / NCIMB 9735 / NBRC 12172) TaxID=945021 RepID=A0AAN1VRU5_TETHN|nr:peptide ABC transporter substrate-binding protein [Tetragenococcus halophilus]AOF49591.1 peptide ABC transporter substrate-binding protein [Tetragenococcus halophilus]MCO7026976.1 peptide ABC transporter substrate-binding protein [Tetragenococcus halophilus]MCO8285842.1 peptide ABC transporter substrate-binding protein [Tetragenococcus halophilus]MCO8294099.1 peptide ABC transporter substrate-binding protein [Tetragenococcus halophilus]NWO00351.1 peptide ABC transporter substrate-binding pr